MGDPAQILDVPANAGLEALKPGEAPNPLDQGAKATIAYYPDDPSMRYRMEQFGIRPS